MVPRFYPSKLCDTLNFRHIYNATLHSKPTTKVRRKLIRGEKKKIDKQTSKEGITYEAGGYECMVVSKQWQRSMGGHLGLFPPCK